MQYVTGFQTGSGQAGFSQEGHKFLTCCHSLCLMRTCCHKLPGFAAHLPMKVDYGKLWHFCDDPVCPYPVWKLSSMSRRSTPDRPASQIGRQRRPDWSRRRGGKVPFEGKAEINDGSGHFRLPDNSKGGKTPLENRHE